jgi:chromosome segregation ATPase
MQPQLSLTKQQAIDLYKEKLRVLTIQIKTNESCLSPLESSHAALSARLKSGVTMSTIADAVREMAAALIALMNTQILQLTLTTSNLKIDCNSIEQALKEAESPLTLPRRIID